MALILILISPSKCFIHFAKEMQFDTIPSPHYLNKHHHRIGTITDPTCSLCGYRQETIKHLLFECPNLSDLRTQLLPPQVKKHITFYGIWTQLK